MNFNFITPYYLLVFPRMFICLLSFLVDYSLYKLCVINSEKYKSRLLILSSSFVMIIYGTRTFTNSIELILFALLLYYVGESMIFSNVVLRQREYINKRYHKTKNPVERAKFHKLRLILTSDSYRNCFQIATISVLGFFNRPSFLCYALFPLFFWLYRGIGYRSVMSTEFHIRIMLLILSSTVTIVFLILVDSFFYGYISWGEIGMLDVSINSFVFPPLNFIKYNIDSNNLARHGLHPRYLHFLVNIPLLFNVLGVLALFGIASLLIKLIRGKYNLLPTVRSIKGLMTASFVTPTILLSLFPHQESRFIIPIILPLVYLHAFDIYKEPDHALIKAPKNTTNKKDLTEKKSNHKSHYLLKAWFSVNVLCVLYFGFIQQGGVLPVTAFLSNEVNDKPYYNYHVVTSHIYSIPHAFLLQPDTEKVFYKNKSKYQISKHVFTYERGSKDTTILLRDISAILNTANNKARRYRMFLLISGSLLEQLEQAMKSREFSQIYMKNVSNFYPHFSAEALPDFSELIHILSVMDMKSLKYEMITKCLINILRSFSLSVFEVKLIKPQSI